MNPRGWNELARIVRMGNELELLVIVWADSTSPEFWSRCARVFGSRPIVLLEGPAEMVAIARGAGVRQALVASGETGDANTIRDGDALATGWGLPVNTPGAECESIPRDPTQAEAMIEESLARFDAQAISWIAPRFEPGVLLGNYWSQDASTLENGWSCGAPGQPRIAGIGELVRFRLWGGGVRGLFIVNGGGGMLIPRGSIAIGYGPVLALKDTHPNGARLPVKLAGVEVRVTDRLGVMRRANILYVSAGWGQVNFIVPDGSAAGPAKIMVRREDGSVSAASTTIVDAEPSLWSAYGTGFGPAVGFVKQTRANGTVKEFPAFQCSRTECRAVAIPLRADARTELKLHATGLRYAGPKAEIHVKIGGFEAKVLSVAPAGDAGNEDVTLELPAKMRGLGERDVICRVNGRLANVVRVNLGRGDN